jgi:hypothetical protein
MAGEAELLKTSFNFTNPLTGGAPTASKPAPQASRRKSAWAFVAAPDKEKEKDKEREEKERVSRQLQSLYAL